MQGRRPFLHSTLLAGIAAVVCWSAGAARAADAEASAQGVEFFEKNIRPILADRCYNCHSGRARSLKANLRLDSWEGMQKGGESGSPAVVAGNADQSRLIVAIRYTDKGMGDHDPLRMPPPKGGSAQKLSHETIQHFEQWVSAGAPHPTTFDHPPKEVASASGGDESTEHWAFKKPVEPAIPQVKHSAWVKNPIDAFVLAKLEEKGLSPAPPAEQRTLIRRAYFDLIGLPPTPEEVAAFEADDSTDAFAKVVDHLLASPRYGERWGRYWLDVARYADTKGYVFQEERKYPYAYTYRDWVIRAFNEDKPYDQFLIDQIAADKLDLGNDKHDLAAMGFLTLGRRFLNVKADIIDDRLDVVFRGTMALTVGCARCHDHKFDPIPTKDYYSLYAVFNNSQEPGDLPLIGEPEDTPAYQAFKKELDKRQAEYDTYVHQKVEQMAAELRTPTRIADYLLAAQFPTSDKVQAGGKVDLNRFQVAKWKQFLDARAGEHDPVFAAWREYAKIPAADFASKSAEVTERIAAGADAKPPIHPLVAKEFEGNPPKSMREVAERYGNLLARYDKPDRLSDENKESLRQILRGGNSPLKVPEGTPPERLLRRDFREHANALWQKVDQWKANNPSAPPRAMVLEDAKTIEPQRVFMRGNPGNPGPEVKPHFLTCLAGSDAPVFSHGSGRLELAKDIASKDNPLTARVMVNRVWLHHFGQGLVRTPSDFGTRADPPSHPELLDWLALRFMEHNWSIKELHRLIMLSSTYQQSSNASPKAEQIDADNTLLSHMNRQRLDFEATRDSLIYVTGKMDLTLGGRAVDITADPSPARRTIYAFIDRQNLPGLFRNFDFASPDATSPRRFTTTVPQQALFMMNSPFMVQQVRGVLNRPDITADEQTDARIKGLYRDLFDREPTQDELALGRSFLAGEPASHETVVWQSGYGEYDAAAGKVKGFTPLAHFVDKKWQGGAKLPDEKLGWVSLWAEGGHPGNDRQHAAIRRWTSPISGFVSINGTIAHKEQKGDGVHAVIVSSRLGELASWMVCHNEAATIMANVEVHQGDTIDFLVDCRGGPAYDSFTWAPVIEAHGGAAVAGNDGPERWSAASQFAGPKLSKALSPWEKYVQVLLESNEFVFVD